MRRDRLELVLEGAAELAETSPADAAFLLEFPDIDGSLMLNLTTQAIHLRMVAEGDNRAFEETIEIPHG
jgi:hypothetical protein